jgi:hypothetical protein
MRKIHEYEVRMQLHGLNLLYLYINTLNKSNREFISTIYGFNDGA